MGLCPISLENLVCIWCILLYMTHIQFIFGLLKPVFYMRFVFLPSLTYISTYWTCIPISSSIYHCIHHMYNPFWGISGHLNFKFQPLIHMFVSYISKHIDSFNIDSTRGEVGLPRATSICKNGGSPRGTLRRVHTTKERKQN